ncbi:MAG: capsular polysaccharide synthesis protein [Pseudomonadota bacterium]
MRYYQHLFLRAFMKMKLAHAAFERRGYLKERTEGQVDVNFDADPVSSIPRNIFMFWGQGLDAAPELVRSCVKSWEDMNPGWQVNVLTEAHIDDFVSMDDIPPDLPWAARADILRLRLLRKYGGVWADATLFCERPLDEWLENYLTEGFFVFFGPGPAREIANWFIASKPDAFLLVRWNEKVTEYWERATQPDAYIWPHYVFEYLKLTEQTFRRSWEKVLKVRPDKLILVNRLITNRLPKNVTEQDVLALRGKLPVAKLTHKHNASFEIFEHYVAHGA